MGPRAGLARCKISRPYHHIFVRAFLFLLLSFLSMCTFTSSVLTLLISLLHKTNIHAPRNVYFVLCALSALLCPDCPCFALCPYCTTPLSFICTSLSWLCLLSFLYNTHNTHIHAPGGIRTRHPNDCTATGLGNSIPGPPSPQRVAIPTELCLPTKMKNYGIRRAVWYEAPHSTRSAEKIYFYNRFQAVPDRP